jgi:MFS family permease
VTQPEPPTRVPVRIAGSVALGTLLNPLNSSMIAVALVAIQGEFRVGFTASSWLISGFYLAASVGQPLMGRLADRLGPRRVFCTGLVVVGVTGVLALFSPGFGWLVAARVLQAVGSSAAFPAGLVIIRRLAGGKPPAGTLGTLSAANSASAAFGPVLGGLLVALTGWRGIFAVNIPVTVIGLVVALRWLPRDPPRTGRLDLRDLDLPGVGFFAVTITALLGLLLSPANRWLLAFVVPVAAALLVWWEWPTRNPFLDVRGLARDRRLLGVLGQQTAVQAVFYMIFFGLPQWLEHVRLYPPFTTGLLMLPVAALGVVLTPVAARVIRGWGATASLLIGAVGLIVGADLLLLVVNNNTSATSVVAVTAALGLPVAFNNIGLQAGLYAAAPAGQAGTAAGLFQTGRYVGAILSTALLGVLFNGVPSSDGLRRVALVVGVAAILLAAVAPLTPAPGGRHRPGALDDGDRPPGSGLRVRRPHPGESPSGPDRGPA